MIKKITLLSIIVIFISIKTVSSNIITLGYVDFPPYEFEENGKPGGILVEIVKTIFNRADIPLRLEFLPFKRAYLNAKDGEIDGLFNFYKTEERLEFFDYTAPIIKNPLFFFVRKDSEIEFKGELENLSSLIIGVMRGYTYGLEFDKNPFLIKDAADSHLSNFKKLIYERIDIYPCDKFAGNYTLITNGLASEIKMLPELLVNMNGYIGFTKGKHQETINRINNAILEMNQTSEIEIIINNYLKKEKK